MEDFPGSDLTYKPEEELRAMPDIADHSGKMAGPPKPIMKKRVQKRAFRDMAIEERVQHMADEHGYAHEDARNQGSYLPGFHLREHMMKEGDHSHE